MGTDSGSPTDRFVAPAAANGALPLVCRPGENGSGTDHGAAGTSFIIGTRSAGRMVGEFPGLATLDAEDNLRATSDFRAMYCSLLEQWFGTDAGLVIPNASSFARPTLVR